MNGDFSIYPSVGVKENKPDPAQFTLRKLRFAVSPPGQQAGRKRTCNDGDDIDEEENEAKASIASVREQLKHEEKEITAVAIDAVRDYFVLERFAWQTRYYRTAICRLHTIKDKSNTHKIRLQIDASLNYWAKWHTEMLTKDLSLESQQACANFLDAFTLIIANWHARAVQLQVYFSDYQDPSHRYRRSITETAKSAIDAHFVRDPILWNAVTTAVNKLARWERPMQKDMLDRITLLERVYSNNVYSSPVVSGITDPFNVNTRESPRKFDLATAQFSPVIHVLQTGIDYSIQQVTMPSAPNKLEDWAARAKFWIDRVGAVSRYLVSRVCSAKYVPRHTAIRPELHTLHKCIEDTLPLLLPQLAAHALGSLPDIPRITELLQSISVPSRTHELLRSHLYNVMYSLTLQLTRAKTSMPINERLTLLGVARDRLGAFSAPEWQSLLIQELTAAMQDAFKANAGSLLVQLRYAVRNGHHLAPTSELRGLDLKLTLDDDLGDDDEFHSRVLAESVAIDLLPPKLGGSSLDPKSELDTLAIVAGDFKDRGAAFTWMPLVMATEAEKNKTRKVALLHYVAWLSHQDPLLTSSAPALVPTSLLDDTSLRDVKWHPSWSIVDVKIGNSTFSCSFVQFEIIDRLLKSNIPLPESELVNPQLGEPQEASRARRAALIDLVYNSKGFVRFNIEEELYAIDSSVPPKGSFAIARFPHGEDDDDT